MQLRPDPRAGAAAPFVHTREPLPRRAFLRAAGVLLGLPYLEAMARRSRHGRRDAADGFPRRIFAVCNNLGFLPAFFFPRDPGRDYAPSPYLELLGEHRADFTVFSGMSHPGVDGGHASDICFLTAAPHPASGGFRNSVSLDQVAAERIGHLTRIPSLTLGVNVVAGVRSLSWTGTGALIPCEEKAARVFGQLFLQGSPEEVEAEVRRLERGRSIMEAVADQARRVQAELGRRDRERLDQYLTGIRDLEKRMQAAKQWEHRPKPRVNASPPRDPDSPELLLDKTRVLFDVARLALESDSTRLITLMVDSVNSPALEVPGVDIRDSYHNLSHHGKAEAKLSQLRAIEEANLRLLAGLLRDLAAVQEGERRLLDRTMLLYGSNMGNANTHETTRLPILLAGGGFPHGQHVVGDEHKDPLANVFVSMLRRLGLEIDSFASSTGPMSALESA